MSSAPPNSGDRGRFYNFQLEGSTVQKQSTGRHSSADNNDEKPLKKTQACVECKRRKIRCDGNQPCQKCLSSRAPKRCLYDKRIPRVLTSRRTVEGLSQSLEECRSILNRLYPNRDIGSLLLLTRQELLDLLHKTPPHEVSPLPPPPLTFPLDESEHSPSQEDNIGLASLEQIPNGDVEWDEERRERDHIPDEADDINALSLSMDKQASYLGASSIKAALMVMLKIQPRLNDHLKPTTDRTEVKRRLPPIRRRSSSAEDESLASPSWKTQNYVDAYFKRVHVFIPMLDESAFRRELLDGRRQDSPWLALVNAVLALGSIAASKSKDYSHLIYYHRAMDHLHIDVFGSSRVETVQALTIIGGFYLHYVNRPNMASAVLGSTMRMACALGLHREPPSPGNSAAEIRATELRRRTWWSLFCLDTWGSTTMGRPSFGRWGPAINVHSPELGLDQVVETSQHAGVLPIIENIKFCKIATHIQDVLASTPRLGPEERELLDLQLRTWYENLPWLLRTNGSCAESLYIARCVMKWRYQNLRMLLHRHVLLEMASQGKANDSPHNNATVDLCLTIATETIEDISKEWKRTQMLGWNAAWFLYQAVMIPLVSIFWQQDNPRAAQWRESIELVIELLDKMEDWSVTATRSREVVLQMYKFALEKPVTQAQLWSVDGAGHDGTKGETNFNMPLGVEITDEMTAQGQSWGWDLDGMFWEESTTIPQPFFEKYNLNEDDSFLWSYDDTNFQGTPIYPQYLD